MVGPSNRPIKYRPEASESASDIRCLQVTESLIMHIPCPGCTLPFEYIIIDEIIRTNAVVSYPMNDVKYFTNCPYTGARNAGRITDRRYISYVIT